ncbi:MAG: hypothetical protein JSU86_01800 [Phycisphaerales bacterium]|nr:MAG: hypothetical protein JSU86_01800 [Phycisphaerales bacterium]
MKLADLRPAPFNPREIDDAASGGLATSIAEFGDISGIVWNRRNGYLVAGHQRLKALTDQGYELIEQGTVVFLRLNRSGDGQAPGIFPVRVVDWPDDKHKAALVAANSQLIAGEFRQDQLDAVLLELQDDCGLPDDLRFDELLSPTFNPDDLVDSFGADIGQQSEYGAVTLVFHKADLPIVQAALKRKGPDELATEIVKMCRDVQ